MIIMLENLFLYLNLTMGVDKNVKNFKLPFFFLALFLSV